MPAQLQMLLSGMTVFLSYRRTPGLVSWQMIPTRVNIHISQSQQHLDIWSSPTTGPAPAAGLFSGKGLPKFTAGMERLQPTIHLPDKEIRDLSRAVIPEVALDGLDH